MLELGTVHVIYSRNKKMKAKKTMSGQKIISSKNNTFYNGLFKFYNFMLITMESDNCYQNLVTYHARHIGPFIKISSL